MKDQEARGKTRKFKGLVSRPVGIVGVDRHLERESTALRAEGAVEENLGKARRKVGEFLANRRKTSGK